MPHVRVFTEERDRPALLVVDQRMAMYFGSVLNLKSVTAAEAAAIAAFRILAAGDRVGGIVFDDDQQREFVPNRSRRSVFAMLRAIADFNTGLDADRASRARPGSLNKILEATAKLAHHDHLVIILSDFDGIDSSTHRWLSSIAAHNDLILGLVFDPIARRVEKQRPAIVGDGQRQAEVDLSNRAVVDAVGRAAAERLDRILEWQTEINLSVLPLSAGEETLPQIRRLLAASTPRRRVR